MIQGTGDRSQNVTIQQIAGAETAVAPDTAVTGSPSILELREDTDHWTTDEVRKQAERTGACEQPVLFDMETLKWWATRLRGLREEKNFSALNAVGDVFNQIRVFEATKHPTRIVDGLLVHVGARGNSSPRISDLFEGYGTDSAFPNDYGTRGTPVDVGALLPASDTPETRRILHCILQGLLEVPENCAGSGAKRFFLGTGAQGELKKPSVGLLSPRNAWVKDAGWTTKDTDRVIEGLFLHHYGDRKWDSLANVLTSPDQRFQGYPSGELFEAAYSKATSSDPFAWTHSVRNREFIGKMMQILEARGLGPELVFERPTKKPKLTEKAAAAALLKNCLGGPSRRLLDEKLRERRSAPARSRFERRRLMATSRRSPASSHGGSLASREQWPSTFWCSANP